MNLGKVSNWWNGGGEDSVHSRVSAPSPHGFATSFFPKNKASKKILDDLIFCFKVCKHVKSNAIVIAKNKQTIGIGAGQMSRIDSTKLALIKASKKNKLNGFVAASDAFFPFTDGIKLLFNNNCKAIIQPQGSINDSKIIDFANKKRLPLYFSKYRLFKH